MVWLWKGERYGLGLLRELNAVHRDDAQNSFSADPEDVLDMQAQYGCGRATGSQLPWLFLYVLNACASVVGFGLAVVLHEDVHRISTSIINFALSHGVILLASVIHHVPTKRPHSCLLKFLRILLLASCMNEIYGAYLEVTHRHDRD